MHTRILVAGLTAACLFLTQGAVNGQENRNANNREHNIRRASQINGKYVKNADRDDAETIGTVNDMVMSLKDGRIVYVAVAHGQTLGFGGKLFAISPEAFRPSSNGEFLVLEGFNRGDFEKAQGFDANSWPREADANWNRREGKVEKAVKEAGQNVKEAVQGKDDRNLTRVSSVIGMAVRTPEDKSLGHVYDLALDCDKHQVAYAAVNYGSTLGIGGKLIAVPWDRMMVKSLTLQPGSNVFVINTTQDEFQRVPSFNNDNWPNQPDEQFWSRVKANNNRD